MRIKATVIYPIQVSLDIDKDMSIEEAQQLIKQEADKVFETSSIDSVIQFCTEEMYEE